MRRIGEHALVLGAGMSGLLAARVLAGAFERVTVIERDSLPASGSNRKGTPQGRHAHVLLPRGQRVLDELFPGIVGELAAAGAVTADPGVEHRFTVGGHLLRSAASGEHVLQMSRPFLESRVRERVRALPDVAIVEGHDVVGLAATDPHRVTGARIIGRTAGSAEQVVAADLMVDATGRGSRTPAWLDAIGYRPPPAETIRVGVTYASRYVRMQSGSLGSAKAVVVGPRPGLSRGMGMLAVEGGRWLLTLAGIQDRNLPPTDPDGFLKFAGTVAASEVHAAIRAAEPLGPVSTYRYPADLRRHYERLRHIPAGLLVVGDALCSFNPIYAQGMTVAAIEALVLNDCLGASRTLDSLGRRYFRAAAKAVNTPWRMAVAADLAMPEVEGRRTSAVRLLNAYTRRVQAAAAHDATVARQFMRVIGLLDPPSRLMRPVIVARALRPGH